MHNSGVTTLSFPELPVFTTISFYMKSLPFSSNHLCEITTNFHYLFLLYEITTRFHYLLFSLRCFWNNYPFSLPCPSICSIYMKSLPVFTTYHFDNVVYEITTHFPYLFLLYALSIWNHYPFSLPCPSIWNHYPFSLPTFFTTLFLK